MTAVQVLDHVRRRGVRLRLRSDGGILEAVPPGRLTDADRAALRAHLAELKRLVARHVTDADRQGLEDAGAGDDSLATEVLATVAAPEPIAWRLYSHRLDRELWVAGDLGALGDLERDGIAGLPVILADDLHRLRDLEDEMLQRVLDVTATRPGARVLDVVPELPDDQEESER